MAIKIAANLKKSMLERLGIVKILHGSELGANDHWDAVPVVPSYGVTGNQAYLEVSNVVLPVESGTTVDTINLMTGAGSSIGNGVVMATITLEGSEIHEYTVNGTYTINNLRISF